MIKHIVVAITLVLGTAMVAWAQQSATQSSAQLARISEQIRQNQIDVGSDYSMNQKGRFHIIHVDKVQMVCANCHQGDRYRPDYLSVSRDEPSAKNAPGKTVRSVCLGCHQEGGLATKWYNSSIK